MKEFLNRYGKIVLALLLIFASGGGAGWAVAQWRKPARSAPPLIKVDSSEVWTKKSLTDLRDQLRLDEDQMAKIEPVLQGFAEKAVRERDRAIFLCYLELFQLHDDLASNLKPSQKILLDQSREKLLESIKEKFPQFLGGPAVPPDSEPPTASPQ